MLGVFNCFNPLSVETQLSLNKLIELDQYEFVLKHLKKIHTEYWCDSKLAMC